MIKILFISDTVGHDGLNLCADFVPLLKRDLKIDFCIVNGENSDDGKGITKKQASKLKSAGVDVITSGNHIWQKSGLDVLSEPALNTLRPANYPEENPGRGFIIVSNSGCELVVINLQGRSFLPPIDCPFKKAMEIISAVKKNNPVIFVDFHAEASAEKLAMGWYLDGKVSAVIGTIHMFKQQMSVFSQKAQPILQMLA